MSLPGPGLARRPLAERLVRGASWAMMNRVLALPVAVVSTMLLARLLSPADLGAYFLAFSLANLLAIVAQLGLCGPIIKLVSAALAEDRPEAARQAIGVGFKVTVIGGVVLAFAMTGGPGHALAGLLADGERLLEVLPLVALLVPAFALIELSAESLRGFHDLRANSILGNALAHRVLLMAALMVLWLMGWPGSLSDVLLISVVVSALLTLAGVVLVSRHLRALERRGERPPARDVLRHAPHFLLIQLNFWLMTNADLWFLGMYRAPEEVALYGAAYRIAGLVGVPILVGNTVLAPVVAELYARRDHARLERVARGAATAAFLSALALILVFASQGKSILGLVYTSAYSEAYAILIVLGVARLAHAGVGAGGVNLTMTGHEQDAMRIGVVTSLLTVAGYVMAVPAYGAFGAALVTAASIVLYQAALALASWRRLGVRGWATLSPATMHDLVALVKSVRPGRPEPLER